MGWTWRLLAVACLSVAAKMEETAAPPPEELQRASAQFVFLSAAVRRMELFLMTVLRWRMRPVTPFDFVEFFAGLLSAGGAGAASDVILATQRGRRRRQNLQFLFSVLFLRCIVLFVGSGAAPWSTAVGDCGGRRAMCRRGAGGGGAAAALRGGQQGD